VRDRAAPALGTRHPGAISGPFSISRETNNILWYPLKLYPAYMTSIQNPTQLCRSAAMP
jgi:hypothetical protein